MKPPQKVCFTFQFPCFLLFMTVEDLYCSTCSSVALISVLLVVCISQFRSLNRNWERAELDEEIRRNAQSVRVLKHVLYHSSKYL